MLNIQKNIKLADYSTFRIGGPAKEFVIVKSENELLEAINYTKENNLKFFILGGGSNVLFDDEGFDGLIVKIRNTKHQIFTSSVDGLDTEINCDAGLLLSETVNIARDNNLSGLEWAAGIPGTIGGAVFGNTGAFGSDMSYVVSEIKVLDIKEVLSQRLIRLWRKNSNFLSRRPAGEIQSDSLKLKVFSGGNCKFGYRDSIFKKNPNLIIISAKIKLEKKNRQEIENKMKEILKKRLEKQPKGFSSGSFFVNPIVFDKKLKEKFEAENGAKCRDNKVPAGWLIDRAGLRGKKVERAMVSEKHANFIINDGSATSKDIVMLADIIKQEVKNKFGVELKEEVKYVSY